MKKKNIAIWIIIMTLSSIILLAIKFVPPLFEEPTEIVTVDSNRFVVYDQGEFKNNELISSMTIIVDTETGEGYLLVIVDEGPALVQLSEAITE